MSDFENGKDMKLFIVLTARKSLVKVKRGGQLQGALKRKWEEGQRRH